MGLTKTLMNLLKCVKFKNYTKRKRRSTRKRSPTLLTRPSRVLEISSLAVTSRWWTQGCGRTPEAKSTESRVKEARRDLWVNMELRLGPTTRRARTKLRIDLSFTLPLIKHIIYT